MPLIFCIVCETPNYSGSEPLLRMFCSVYSVFIVLFYVLFVCKCVLYYRHRVPTQLQLTNIPSYQIHLHQWHGRWESSKKICKFQSDKPTAWLSCLTDCGGGAIFSRSQKTPSRRQKMVSSKMEVPLSIQSPRRLGTRGLYFPAVVTHNAML